MTPPHEAPPLKWWEFASFAAVHAATSVLLFCLTLSGLYRFGRFFGTLEWLINYKRRRRFAEAFERVVGGQADAKTRRAATREFFQRTRCDKLFYLILDRIPHDQAVNLLSIGNKPVLDRAVESGRGVYLALSHQGPHHVAAMLLRQQGYRVAGVRNRREGGIRRYVQYRHDRLGEDSRRFRIIFSDGYPRDIYRCFKDGYILGSLMDVSRVHRPHQKSEEVTIFGERRRFLSGPLRIAVRCGAPVLQAFIVPESGFRYRLDVVDQLVDPTRVDDEDAAVARAMQSYAANVERYIRAAPALITRV